jgi:spore germination protein KB
VNYNNFTREQVLFLTFVAGCGNMAYTFTWATYLSGRSSWLAVAIGILLTIPFYLCIAYICSKYPGCTIFDIIETGLGKVIGLILFIIYSTINIVLSVSMINMFTGAVKMYFLQLTPVWIIMLFLIFMGALFVNNSTLLFGRTVELLTIWYIINYFAGFSLSFVKGFRMENITPIFDTSLLNFSEGVFFSLGAASEILILSMVMVSHIPDPYKHKRWVIRGICLWSFILALAVFLMQGILGYELLLRTSSAGIGVSRIIFLGDFIRGLEVFILATYQVMLILKISAYLYAIWIPIKKRINIKYSSFILLIIVLLMLIPSVMLNSYNNAYFLSVYVSYFILIPFIAIVLLFAFLSFLILKKKSGSDLK